MGKKTFNEEKSDEVVENTNVPLSALRLERTQMISSTEITRRFGEYLDRARNERLFVLRNNSIEGVLLGIEDYERMAELEELVEHLLVAKIYEERRNEPEEIDLETLLRQEGLDPDELRRTIEE